ncbi:MAG TPA: PD-(D/E)XK nuclease family protein [Vicinamibacterales bacterium]|nr:PD-(D/E)XK nuclease family protein [Vicinamibacterales bacterium]
MRVPDLRSFQHAIVRRLPAAPIEARRCALLVPSHAAAEELRRTIERSMLRGPSVAAMPDLLTRDGLYARLHERLGAPPLLSNFDREVLFRRAAREAAAAGHEPPFQVRAGLIVEMLALYDELRRRHKTVDAFERLLLDSLQDVADTDRGAERMLRQTRFLVAAFRAFDAHVSASGRLDEHGLRARALAHDGIFYTHVIIAIPDQTADRRGLWIADADLLARLPGLTRIDLIATEGLLASGFHQRVHDQLFPGIEEERESLPQDAPVLVVPDVPPGAAAPRTFLCRDREEELVDVARLLRTERPSQDPARVAVVFQRPLPYLYLARHVFADAGVPYQAADALPLAAEPFAAAVDLLFEAMAEAFTRATLIALLRSPHFRIEDGGRPLAASDIAALDRALVEWKYLGDADRLAALAERANGRHAGARPALDAALGAARELQAVAGAERASAQIAALLAWIAAHERHLRPEDPWASRHLRARGAVLAALERLREAHAAFDDEPLSVAELAGTVRRWIEGQTFSPRSGRDGVVLLDARAAAFADLDEIRLVGLVEGDWPEPSPRSIFYPSSLLTPLGWPADPERVAAARAQFLDLLRLPRRRVSVSTVTLEDDSLVSPSPLVDDIDAAGLAMERRVAGPPVRVLAHEALIEAPVASEAICGAAAEWLALRLRRTGVEARCQGQTGAREPRAYAVSHVETYLSCPFKYFAAHVLRLPEEREEQGWLTPQERGQLVHEVFRDFFAAWQASGRGAITLESVDEALALFTTLAERRLEDLPEGDRALERTFLMGSAAAPGLAERAFAFEIEQGTPVVERLLEHELSGTFTFQGEEGVREVRLRGKADRIDLLADGSLRLIDYKLGRAPDRQRALQLPIYGVCAAQALDGRHGRSWRLSSAGYVAFRERLPFVPLCGGAELPDKLDDGVRRLLDALDAIERGDFPVDPFEPYRCTWCAYPAVCRKDYVGDE